MKRVTYTSSRAKTSLESHLMSRVMHSARENPTSLPTSPSDDKKINSLRQALVTSQSKNTNAQQPRRPTDFSQTVKMANVAQTQRKKKTNESGGNRMSQHL